MACEFARALTCCALAAHYAFPNLELHSSESMARPAPARSAPSLQAVPLITIGRLVNDHYPTDPHLVSCIVCSTTPKKCACLVYTRTNSDVLQNAHVGCPSMCKTSVETTAAKRCETLRIHPPLFAGIKQPKSVMPFPSQGLGMRCRGVFAG